MGYRLSRGAGVEAGTEFLGADDGPDFRADSGGAEGFGGVESSDAKADMADKAISGEVLVSENYVVWKHS